MADFSTCGIDCDNCKFRLEQNCKGCNSPREKCFGENVSYINVILISLRNIVDSAISFLAIN